MISVVVPVHNEAAHLYDSVNGFLSQLDNILLELLLVENGSKDNTLEICRRLSADSIGKVRSYTIEKPSYGGAIRKGVQEAKGEYIVILEADYLSPEFVRDSIDSLEKGGYEVIIASKQHPQSVDNRGVKRRLLTWGFNFLLRTVFGLKGTDTHGLKAFKNETAQKLFGMALTDGEALQTEVILLAEMHEMPIKEVPIDIREIREAPISVFRRIPKVWKAMVSIRKSINFHNRNMNKA